MGLLTTAKKVKEAGQGGDTELVHINKGEKQILEKDLGKKATQNPKTGLPQYTEDLSAYDAAAKAYYEVNADLFKGVPYDEYMKAWNQSQGGLTAEQYKAYTTYLEQAKTGQDFDLYKGVITPQTLKDEQSVANAQAGSAPGEGENWDSLPDSDPLKINHMQDVQAQQQAAAVGGYSNLGQVQMAQFQKYGTDRLPGVFTNFLQKWLLPIALSAATFGVASGIGAAGGAAAGGTTGSATGTAAGAAGAAPAAAPAAGSLAGAAAIPEIVVTGAAPAAGIGAGLGGAAAAAGAGAGAGVSGALGGSPPATGAPAAEPIPEVTVTGNPLPGIPTGGALAGDMLGAGIAGNIGAGIVSNGTAPAAESSEGMDKPFGDNPPTEDPGMSNPMGDNPNIGQTSGNQSTLGGYLSKANDFLKTPIGQGLESIAGSVLTGIGKGKEAQAEQDAINQRARYYDTQWRDPNQLAQLKAAVVDNTPVSNGYLTRAKQVSDFLNSRQINTMQPGDPNKVYGSYVRGS